MMQMQPQKNLFNIFLHQVHKGNDNISYTLFKKFELYITIRGISPRSNISLAGSSEPAGFSFLNFQPNSWR